ncbi:putative laccase-9 [Dichanthelium oligosanthes]|uniref:Laccase n=1 Tax=Dichanthelium oligosanthes TaxID=888268 RepID=A0A1E5V7N2_9POAL|nr:putative laccase-9 [Dichanthelium oligosanthes]
MGGGVAKMPTVLWLLLGVVVALGVAASPAQAARTNLYDFFVKETNVTRLCHEKAVLAVNGQFPGPTIYARKGDVVVVNVHNQGSKNITIHWHGVDQPRNPWFDGPEYITQCPIRPGASFTYTIILSGEEGTLWWHAHSDFDRATVHGAIVVHPKLGSAYPYPKPHKEIPIILGEWWNADVEQMLEETKRTGSDFNISDANTINGQPGDLFPCSENGISRVIVEQGKTYLLRVINAGLTNDMFFAVAGHRLTVVGTDGHYLKPFTVDHVMISSGQTMDVLLHAANGSAAGNNSRYYMAARTFATNTQLPVNNSTATAILQYADAPPTAGPPDLPNLPAVDDLAAATAYTAQLRSLATEDHPVDVPAARVDEHMLVTISINVLPCGANETCKDAPINGTRFAASLNNVSFVSPGVDVLDAYYSSIRGVYEPDFPDRPPLFFNFTDPNPADALLFTERGTRVKVVAHGAVVEVVFQDTALLGAESHPMHLHGYSFYVVGRGFGNFDEGKDPATYNLVDPPFQNTVTVPAGGWAAIRFRATNPGVWFMHCHFDRHTVWGMDTVFIVKNGKTPDAQMMPRPPTMPKC